MGPGPYVLRTSHDSLARRILVRWALNDTHLPSLSANVRAQYLLVSCLGYSHLSKF